MNIIVEEAPEGPTPHDAVFDAIRKHMSELTTLEERASFAVSLIASSVGALVDLTGKYATTNLLGDMIPDLIARKIVSPEKDDCPCPVCERRRQRRAEEIKTTYS